MIYFFLILTGLCVGFLSSFFGIGGGSLIIPVLYALVSNAPHEFVIATSLGAIFLNTSLNSYRFYQQGISPSRKEVLAMFFATGLGSLLSISIVESIDKQQAKLIFSFVLIIMILKIIFSKKKTISDSTSSQYSPPKLIITFFLGSIISGITGLGGGIIFVPLLMSFVLMKNKDLSVYSNFAMMITTLTGFLPYFFKPSTLEYEFMIGSINPIFILLLFIGAFFSSKFGVRYNNKVSEEKKKVMLVILFSFLCVKSFI